MSLDNVLIVTVVAFAAPFALGLVPALRLPSVVLEIVAGIVVPVLKDADAAGTPFGQLVIAAGTIADFGCIILLSLLFTGEGGPTSTAILLGGLFAVAAAVFVAVRGAERSRRVMGTLSRLQDTTAQIRVRGAMILLVGFVVLAESFGLEAILGAFAAGAVLALVDRDQAMTHPLLRRKLEAMGFGFFIPVFFVTSGVPFDLDALLHDPANLALVPVFLTALLIVRGVPALLYRGALATREVGAAALLQSTSLPFIVAATAIGQDLGLVDGAQAAALVAAGLLSVLVFPVTALAALTPRARPVSA